MKTRHVIKRSNFRLSPPFTFAILMWLFLDRLGASEWIYGAIRVWIVVWLIVWIVDVINCEEVDVIEKIKE